MEARAVIGRRCRHPGAMSTGRSPRFRQDYRNHASATAAPDYNFEHASRQDYNRRACRRRHSRRALSEATAPRERSRRGRAPWERGALHPPCRKMRVRSLAVPAPCTPPCKVAAGSCFRNPRENLPTPGDRPITSSIYYNLEQDFQITTIAASPMSDAPRSERGGGCSRGRRPRSPSSSNPATHCNIECCFDITMEEPRPDSDLIPATDPILNRCFLDLTGSGMKSTLTIVLLKGAIVQRRLKTTVVPEDD